MSKTQKFRIVKPGYDGQKDLAIYKTEVPDPTAVFAMELLGRWALVAAIPDGEDSAGRAKFRLPTAPELVTRSFDLAEAAMAEARTRGLMTALPDLNEVNAKWDAAQAAKDEAKEAEALLG